MLDKIMNKDVPYFGAVKYFKVAKGTKYFSGADFANYQGQAVDFLGNNQLDRDLSFETVGQIIDLRQKQKYYLGYIMIPYWNSNNMPNRTDVDCFKANDTTEISGQNMLQNYTFTINKGNNFNNFDLNEVNSKIRNYQYCRIAYYDGIFKYFSKIISVSQLTSLSSIDFYNGTNTTKEFVLNGNNGQFYISKNDSAFVSIFYTDDQTLLN